MDSFILFAICFSIASYGSIANYFIQLKEEDSISRRKVVSNIVISTFASTLSFLICLRLGLNKTETVILAGLAGFAGDKFINAAYRKYLDKFGGT